MLQAALLLLLLLQLQLLNTHALVRSSKLENLSDRAKVATLVISQTLDNADVNYVKCIRRNNSRVDVTVVDQVTYDLYTDTQTD